MKTKNFMKEPKPWKHLLPRALIEVSEVSLVNWPPPVLLASACLLTGMTYCPRISVPFWSGPWLLPPLAFWKWCDHSNLQQLCPHVPHYAWPVSNEHLIPAGTMASLLQTAPSAESHSGWELSLFLSFVSKLYFSAEEAGLVLNLCSCSFIGTKTKAFQARLQPPFRKSNKISLMMGSCA